jgi:hypothetical protein
MNWTAHTGTYDIDSVQIRPVLDETQLDALNLANGPVDAFANAAGHSNIALDANFNHLYNNGGTAPWGAYWDRTNGTDEVVGLTGENSRPAVRITGNWVPSTGVNTGVFSRIWASGKAGDKFLLRAKFRLSASWTPDDNNDFRIEVAERDSTGATIAWQQGINKTLMGTDWPAVNTWATLEGTIIVANTAVVDLRISAVVSSTVSTSEYVDVEFMELYKLPTQMDNLQQEWDDVQNANNTKPDDNAITNLDGSNTILDPLMLDSTKWATVGGFSFVTPTAATGFDDETYTQVLQLSATATFDVARTVSFSGDSLPWTYRVPAKFGDVFYVLAYVSTDGTLSGQTEALAMVLEAYTQNGALCVGSYTYENINWEQSQMKGIGSDTGPQWIFGAIEMKAADVAYISPRWQSGDALAATKDWWIGYTYVGKENPLAQINDADLIQDNGFDLQYNYGGFPYNIEDSYWWRRSETTYSTLVSNAGENATPALVMSAPTTAINVRTSNSIRNSLRVKFGDILNIRVRLKLSSDFNGTGTDFRAEINTLDKNKVDLNSWPDFFDISDCYPDDKGNWHTVEGTVTPLLETCEYIDLRFTMGSTPTLGSVTIDSVMLWKSNKYSSNDFQSWTSDAGGLLPNWNLNIRDTEGKPAGIRGIEGVDHRIGLSWIDTGGVTFMRIDGSVDGSQGFGWPAVPIDDQQVYEVRIRHRSDTVDANGLFIRMQEYDSDLPSGKTHIGEPVYEDMVRTRDRVVNLAAAPDAMPTAAFEDDVYTYVPTRGVKFASFSVYAWNGYPGLYDVDFVSIKPKTLLYPPGRLEDGNPDPTFKEYVENGETGIFSHTASVVSLGTLSSLGAPADGANLNGVKFDLDGAYMYLAMQDERSETERRIPVAFGDIIHSKIRIAQDGNLFSTGDNDAIRGQFLAYDKNGFSLGSPEDKATIFDSATYAPVADTWYTVNAVYEVTDTNVAFISARITVPAASTAPGEWYVDYWDVFKHGAGSALATDNTIITCCMILMLVTEWIRAMEPIIDDPQTLSLRDQYVMVNQLHLILYFHLYQ